MIIPLIVLKHDLIQRCMEWNVVCAVYDSGSTPHQLHAVPSLLLIDIDEAVTQNFVAFVEFLQSLNRLNRLVFDEAHLFLTVRHYRIRIGAID